MNSILPSQPASGPLNPKAGAIPEIINSATPLETRYAGVHPRLYATAEAIAELRARLNREPWSGFLRRVRAQADALIQAGPPERGVSGDNARGIGCGLAHLAIARQLTGADQYLEAARAHLAAMAAREDWTTSLMFGHWAHGVAVAYDWLFHELDESLRRSVRQALYDRTRRVFEDWVHYVNAYPTCYTWNHTGVVHHGLLAAGCALWGDLGGIAPILNLAIEKLRLMAGALGPDGASQEGLPYGQYHLDFLLKSMLLADQLCGLDFFTDCAFLKNYPDFMLSSALPRQAWGRMNTFLQFGDCNGSHWYGPDTHLRIVARRYRDPHAQWLAEAVDRAGVCGDSSCFLNLLCYDETLAPRPPDDLPTLRHFTDKDLVFLRGGWDDRAALFAIHCGPAAGHHARRYRQNIAGGHMHPEAATFLLHAGGEWLITDTGYTSPKETGTRNTLLVNGLGQTGGGKTWFEDLEMRRGKPEGRILRVEPGAVLDYVIADAAPAYEPATRLRRFLRHVIYLKPDVWIIGDELEAGSESIFELRFHAPRPFAAAENAAWTMRNGRAALRLIPLGPTPCQARAFRDPVPRWEGCRGLEILALANQEPRRAAFFVTLLHAHAADAPPRSVARLEHAGGQLWLDLERAEGRTRLRLTPGQEDPAQPIYTLIAP